jgi:TFIIF-interacting CTD phosphatase-like protein
MVLTREVDELTPDPSQFGFVLRGKSIQVRKRPFLDKFVTETSLYYDFALFTASRKEYADRVLDTIGYSNLFPMGARFYREDCTLVNGAYKKDLRKIVSDLS